MIEEKPKYKQEFFTTWLYVGLLLCVLPIPHFINTATKHGGSMWDLMWLAGAMVGLMVFRHFQLKGIEKRVDNLPTNPNHHTSDVVGEGTVKPMIKDGYGPINDIISWYVARYEVSIAIAITTIYKGGCDADDRIRKEYDDYLAKFK